jgi:hypothetical protein
VWRGLLTVLSSGLWRHTFWYFYHNAQGSRLLGNSVWHLWCRLSWWPVTHGCLVAADDTSRFQTQYSHTRQSCRNFCQRLTINSLSFLPEILGSRTGNDVVWCIFANVLYRHALKKDSRGGEKCLFWRRYLVSSVTESAVDVWNSRKEHWYNGDKSVTTYELHCATIRQKRRLS